MRDMPDHEGVYQRITKINSQACCEYKSTTPLN